MCQASEEFSILFQWLELLKQVKEFTLTAEVCVFQFFWGKKRQLYMKWLSATKGLLASCRTRLLPINLRTGVGIWLRWFRWIDWDRISFVPWAVYSNLPLELASWFPAQKPQCQNYLLGWTETLSHLQKSDPKPKETSRPCARSIRTPLAEFSHLLRLFWLSSEVEHHSRRYYCWWQELIQYLHLRWGYWWK